MEQLIQAFGIDARLIIIQVVNFGFLMVALTYFLYKPVLNVLKERQDKIAQGIVDAEEANKARLEAAEEKKKVIAAANKEAEAMTSRAKEHAALKASEIIEEAHTKAEQVIKDAVDRGNELKILAMREADAEIAKITLLAVEKVLNQRT